MAGGRKEKGQLRKQKVVDLDRYDVDLHSVLDCKH